MTNSQQQCRSIKINKRIFNQDIIIKYSREQSSSLTYQMLNKINSTTFSDLYLYNPANNYDENQLQMMCSINIKKMFQSDVK